ncbi:protein shisa-5-like [Sebastes umbrosus]|uniref:protein shisa-5-like n=1 Tax=Sebastes umbrosus TaxID=72105 RepID=UPI00189D83B1|nr:protein shisa-5-like [Sebastes umbrosus]
MVSRVLSSVVCVLWVILLPVASDDFCGAFIDTSGRTHPAQTCGPQFCCGTCARRSCCSDRKYRLTLDAQRRCAERPTTTNNDNDKKSKLGTLLGSILGSIFPIIICVGLIICCFAPCCLIYKKCRKGGNRGSHTPNTTVINGPQQPFPQPPAAPGYQPSHPGYQPVPVDPGFGGQPMPTAPPSYNPANPAPGGYPAGPPMGPYPGQPMMPYPGQPYATPYNPSYTGHP